MTNSRVRRRLALGVVAGWLLCGATPPVDASSRDVRLTITPQVAFEPARLRLRITVRPFADQRVVRVETDGGSYSRATELPLNGEAGPKTLWVDWPNVPAGSYTVTVRVATSTTVVAQDAQTVTVVGRN